MFSLFWLCRKDEILRKTRSTSLPKNCNNVEATFEEERRIIVRLVAFVNVASTLLLVWTRLYGCWIQRRCSDGRCSLQDCEACATRSKTICTHDRKHFTMLDRCYSSWRHSVMRFWTLPLQSLYVVQLVWLLQRFNNLKGVSQKFPNISIKIVLLYLALLSRYWRHKDVLAIFSGHSAMIAVRLPT